MSHVSVSLLQVVVAGMAALTKTVAECGLDVLAERQLRLEDGKIHKVDGVITDGKTKVGVSIDPKTKVATFIPQDCEKGKGKALAQKVAQRYAYSRVVEELKRKGYQIGKEEKQKDGTMKITASRWG